MLFSLKGTLTDFIFISSYLNLYEEHEKMAANTIFIVTVILSINSFAFTFKKIFFEKPLLKATLCNECTSFKHLEAVEN